MTHPSIKFDTLGVVINLMVLARASRRYAVRTAAWMLAEDIKRLSSDPDNPSLIRQAKMAVDVLSLVVRGKREFAK